MATLLDLARHSFGALRAWRSAADGATATSTPSDPYARRRMLRLQELEAAGKCLARSGKHANLRYWPAERGSRILAEHRRRRRPGTLRVVPG